MTMFKKYHLQIGVLLIIVQFLATSCTNATQNQYAQITPSYPGALFGLAPTNLPVNSLAQKSQSNSSAIATYYIPVTNTSLVPVVVKTVAIESHGNVWSATINDNCTTDFYLRTCVVTVAFNANAVTDPTQLSSVITLKLSNGSISTIPVTGEMIIGAGITMQAPKQIIANNSGNAYGLITAFNNTDDTVLINESGIFTNSSNKWNFTVNCDGKGSKTIIPRSSCSISFTSHGTTSDPSVTQISIPISTQQSNTSINVASKSATSNSGDSQIINVTTTIAPLQNSSYVVYLGSAISLLGNNTTSFSLLNLGTQSAAGIIIDGLPNNITQTNNCNDIAPNGLCTVTLKVLSGTAIPPVTTLQIYAIGTHIQNAQQVYLTGQTLFVSPNLVDFGTQFDGTTIQKDVVISNLGPEALNYQLGNIGGNVFILDSGNCTTNNLVGFESCTLHISYTAPHAIEEYTSNLIINSSTLGESSQTVSLMAKSILATVWTNITESGGYNDIGSEISALIVNQAESTTITLANVAKNVWQLSTNGITWVNIANNFTSYYEQIITAFGIAFDGGFVAGYIDGGVQLCGINAGTCFAALPAQPPFAVTSEINVTEGRGMVGFADTVDGKTGQLLTGDGGGIIKIPEIDAGVGRLATDGPFGQAQYLYVPLSNGQIVMLSEPWTAITQNITPEIFVPNEYATVLFYDLNTNILYAGTNLANVYMSKKPISSKSWAKLTPQALSSKVLPSTAYISSLTTNNNGDVYAGLATRSNKQSGGGLYILPKGESNFIIADPSYNDQSAITNIVFDRVTTQHIYVGTYLGNVWRQ